MALLAHVEAHALENVFDAGHGLKLTVIGPDEERVKALQIEWDKQIKKAGVAKVAESRSGVMAYATSDP